jgi:hypothetical protein
MRESGGQMEGHKHQMVHLDPDFLFFGYGRSGWWVDCLSSMGDHVTNNEIMTFSPGRFFAVNEIKAMLAYILLNYDFRLADGAKGTPPPHWIGGGRSPNAFAKVEFRKRQKV